MKFTIDTQEEHPETLRLLADLLLKVSDKQPLSNVEERNAEQELTNAQQLHSHNFTAPQQKQQTRQSQSNTYQIPNLFEQDTQSQFEKKEAQESNGMVAFNNLFDNYNVDSNQTQQQETNEKKEQSSSDSNRIVFY